MLQSVGLGWTGYIKMDPRPTLNSIAIYIASYMDYYGLFITDGILPGPFDFAVFYITCLIHVFFTH